MGVKLTFFNWLSKERRKKAGGWLVGQPIIDWASHCGGSCDTCHAISSGRKVKVNRVLCSPPPSPALFFSFLSPIIHPPLVPLSYPPPPLLFLSQRVYDIHSRDGPCLLHFTNLVTTTNNHPFHSIPSIQVVSATLCGRRLKQPPLSPINSRPFQCRTSTLNVRSSLLKLDATDGPNSCLQSFC